MPNQIPLHDTLKDTSPSCSTCEACCCRLEVLLTDEPNIPFNLTEEDHWGGWVMRRLDDGWCAALDRNSMRCTIYRDRPRPCREFDLGGDDCLEERSHMADVYL